MSGTFEDYTFSGGEYVTSQKWNDILLLAEKMRYQTGPISISMVFNSYDGPERAYIRFDDTVANIGGGCTGTYVAGRNTSRRTFSVYCVISGDDPDDYSNYAMWKNVLMISGIANDGFNDNYIWHTALTTSNWGSAAHAVLVSGDLGDGADQLDITGVDIASIYCIPDPYVTGVR